MPCSRALEELSASRLDAVAANRTHNFDASNERGGNISHRRSRYHDISSLSLVRLVYCLKPLCFSSLSASKQPPDFTGSLTVVKAVVLWKIV